MATARIEISLGGLTFSGEGEQAWLGQQLDKLLEKAEHLPISKHGGSPHDQNTQHSGQAGSETAAMTLVAFLQKTKSTTNQVKKYVAAAAWTMAKNRKTEFVTKDVTSALSTAQQSRLGNAAQCLANAVKAGYVEKLATGQYFITPAGKTYLGLPE